MLLILYATEDLDTSMSTITSIENIIAEHETLDSDEEVDIEEEPQFSEALSERDVYPDTESNSSDLSESELSSDDEDHIYQQGKSYGQY